MSQELVFENVVLSHPYLFSPRQYMGKGAFNYTCLFILPANFDWSAVQTAIAEAQAGKWGANVPVMASIMYDQVKKGPYQGRYFIKGTRQEEDGAPQVVMQDPSVPVGPHQHGEFFAGAIVNVYGRAFAHDKPGVSFGMNAIQLVRNTGDDIIRLDGAKSAVEVFKPIAGAPQPIAAVPGQPMQAPAQPPQGAPVQPGMPQAPIQQQPVAPQGAPAQPGMPQAPQAQAETPVEPWNR
jgi:hypothetical protein